MSKSMNEPLDAFTLYGDLRPDEQRSSGDLADLRAELFGPEVRATRDEGPPANGVSKRTVTNIETHQRRQAKRRMLVGLAAAVIMIGVAGIVISAQRSPQSITGIGTESPSPAPSNPNRPASTVAAPGAVSTADNPATPPGDDPPNAPAHTMFMVPDYLPAGMAVTSASAGNHWPSWVRPLQRWAQVDSTGKVTGLVVIHYPTQDIDTPSDLAAADVTVRGQPGQLRTDDQNDHVLDILSWRESGWGLQVTGVDSARGLIPQVAESLRFDPQTGTINFPEASSMGLIAESDLSFVDPNAVATGLGAGPSVLVRSISITSGPNTLGRDLKSLLTPLGGNLTETTIDGRTVFRLVGPEETYTFWLDQGMRIELQTKPDLPDDELAKIVHGIRFVDAAEYESVVSAMRQRTTAEVSPWPEFDQVTIPAGPTMPSELPNGLTVSLRTRPDGSGANAMCLGSPVVNCAAFLGDNGPASSASSGGSSIAVGDRQIGAVWVSRDTVGATSVPELRPYSDGRPTRNLDGTANINQSDVTTASILADVSTSTGRFVIVGWPVEEGPPDVVFPDDVENGSPISVTPEKPGW